MNPRHPIVARVSRAIRTGLCRLRAARGRLRDLEQVASMTAHELRDLGLSHADRLPLRGEQVQRHPFLAA